MLDGTTKWLKLNALYTPKEAFWKVVLSTLIGAVLLTCAAKVKVPFWPVPMTLQTLAIPFLALGFGRRGGALSVLAYLAAGFIGVPVFANTPPLPVGPNYFLGTTAGYLMAMPLAVWLMATAAAGRRSAWSLALIALIGNLLVLIAGTVWLALFAHLPSGQIGLGVTVAISSGAFPFLLGDGIKAILGALLVAGFRVVSSRVPAAPHGGGKW
jgi:biotin transport system substrate-specific component